MWRECKDLFISWITQSLVVSFTLWVLVLVGLVLVLVFGLAVCLSVPF